MTPAATSKLLSRHSGSPTFDNSFNYRSVIGKLNYLEKASRPDISYAVHQCARFAADPKKEHGDTVRWIGRYLKGTKDQGVIMKPMPKRELAGDWHPKEAALDRDTDILWRVPSDMGITDANGDCALLYGKRIYRHQIPLRDAIPVM